MRKLLIALAMVVVLSVPVLLWAANTRPGGSCGEYPEWANHPCGRVGMGPTVLDYLWPPSHWASTQSTQFSSDDRLAGPVCTRVEVVDGWQFCAFPTPFAFPTPLPED